MTSNNDTASLTKAELGDILEVMWFDRPSEGWTVVGMTKGRRAVVARCSYPREPAELTFWVGTGRCTTLNCVTARLVEGIRKGL